MKIRTIIKGMAFAVIILNAMQLKAQDTGPRLTDADINNHGEEFSGVILPLRATDPELFEVFGNFAFDEVLRYGGLDTRTRIMAVLASTIACQALTEYRLMLDAALDIGITPIEAKEIVYQAVPYAGMSKVVDFLDATNDIFTRRGIALPLEEQSATSPETRFERGLAVQKEIFGERIDDNYKNAPANQIHIQQYLSANCFGDYVARGGLDLKTREMLTFSILLSLGGCEPQLKGHIQGNVNMGNGKEFLLAVVTQLIPYVGYPRALNAIACINEVIPEQG